jgi:protease I
MAKKIAIIIAFNNFRDEEYFIPKQVLELEGNQVITVSSQLGKAIGTYGGEVDVDMILGDIKINEFDAIIFAGGSGALAYLENKTCLEIAKEAVLRNKVLGAICIGPAILAKAGVLSGKKATVWSSPLDKSAIKILKEEGAIFEDNQVVQDGNIITANGPEASRKFGEAIAKLLE